MTLLVSDRIQETTATTGTGTLTLAGGCLGLPCVLGHRRRQPCYYVIDDGAGNWEVGQGTYTCSGTTLSRDKVFASSNSGSLVSFGSGSKNVWVDARPCCSCKRPLRSPT